MKRRLARRIGFALVLVTLVVGVGLWVGHADADCPYYNEGKYRPYAMDCWPPATDCAYIWCRPSV